MIINQQRVLLAPHCNNQHHNICNINTLIIIMPPKKTKKAKRPASNPNNLKHKTSTIERLIVERDAEALNQGNVVLIENTAEHQVIDNATPDASATHASQTTTESAVAAEMINFDPMQYMKRKHSRVVVTGSNKKR